MPQFSEIDKSRQATSHDNEFTANSSVLTSDFLLIFILREISPITFCLLGYNILLIVGKLEKFVTGKTITETGCNIIAF